jgi:methionyl-tRNA formyltransferase
VVVAGQKRFGRAVLELVLERGWQVAAVSAPAGDDKLRIGAMNRRIPVIDAGAFNVTTMPDGCELIVAAHCHSYISAKTRLKAELGALGFHPSLLPRHRGRSAVEWALRFGEAVTGGSVYWFNDTVDGGPVAAQDWCFIRPGDTAGELWRRELAPMGLRLFRRVFDDLERGIVTAIPQDTDPATWEPAIDGVPPLWRPDSLMLGSSKYTVVQERHAPTDLAGQPAKRLVFSADARPVGSP